MIRATTASRSDRFTLLLVALSMAGAALILARQVRYGVGLELDSAHYIGVARKLLAGEGFTDVFAERPYTNWGPLYPLLLVGGSLFVFDPLAIAGPVNAAIFGLTVFAGGRWLRQHLQSRFLIAWACLALVLAIPLTRAASYAMSEALFILLATLSLIGADRFLGNGRRASLIWAAAFTALACLTRYIGVVLPMVILPLLLVRPGVALSERAKHGAAYTLIAAIPIGSWMLFNALRVGALTGSREPAKVTMLEILSEIFAAPSRGIPFYLPSDTVRIAASALAGLLLLVLAIAVGYAFIHSRRKDSAWLEWRPFYLFGGFVIAYFVSLTAVATHTHVAPLGRMLWPMYIPLLFAGVFVLDRFLRCEKERGTRLLTALLACGLSLWLVVHLPLNAREIWLANGERGMGLANATWTDSEVLRYIREASITSGIISSIPAVALYTDTRNYVYLSLTLNGARRKIANAADGDYVVWLHANTTGYTYGVDELDQLPELERVATLSDGVVFRIGKDPK